MNCALRVPYSSNRPPADFFKYFNELANYYWRTLQAVNVVDRVPCILTPTSPFAGISLNYSNQTACDWHADVMNLFTGMCLIIVLGRFDHRSSGQFLMHEARTIVELRPGDFFFTLSSGLGHRNARLVPGHSRSSIVMYSPASLFKWVHDGHTANEECPKGKEAVDALVKEGRQRVLQGFERIGNKARFNL